jgi:hypothetical protein
MRPFTEDERFWPLGRLKAYPAFSLFAPAWPFDPGALDVEIGRRVLKFTSIPQMAAEADKLCALYEGTVPPCPIALFVYQFPNRDFEDCAFAHWALHADKALGPAACFAALAIEPVEYPADAEEIQYAAAWQLARHPWAAARPFFEKALRYHGMPWVSARAKALFDAHFDAHHPNPDGFRAQPARVGHPHRRGA